MTIKGRPIMTHTPDVAGEGLKPCPWCQTAPVVTDGDNWTSVICGNTQCLVTAEVDISGIGNLAHRAEAIAAWNRRPSPAIPDREEIVGGLKRIRFLLTDPARSYSENIARGRSALSDLLAKLEGKS